MRTTKSSGVDRLLMHCRVLADIDVSETAVDTADRVAIAIVVDTVGPERFAA